MKSCSELMTSLIPIRANCNVQGKHPPRHKCCIIRVGAPQACKRSGYLNVADIVKRCLGQGCSEVVQSCSEHHCTLSLRFSMIHRQNLTLNMVPMCEDYGINSVPHKHKEKKHFISNRKPNQVAGTPLWKIIRYI